MLSGEEKLTLYKTLERMSSPDDNTATAALREAQSFLAGRKLTFSDFVTTACAAATPDQMRARELANSEFFGSLDDGEQVFILQSRTRRHNTQKQTDWFNRILFRYETWKKTVSDAIPRH